MNASRLGSVRLWVRLSILKVYLEGRNLSLLTASQGQVYSLVGKLEAVIAFSTLQGDLGRLSKNAYCFIAWV